VRHSWPHSLDGVRDLALQALGHLVAEGGHVRQLGILRAQRGAGEAAADGGSMGAADASSSVPADTFLSAAAVSGSAAARIEGTNGAHRGKVRRVADDGHGPEPDAAEGGGQVGAEGSEPLVSRAHGQEDGRGSMETLLFPLIRGSTARLTACRAKVERT
jgi:hypothetical protein